MPPKRSTKTKSVLNKETQSVLNLMKKRSDLNKKDQAKLQEQIYMLQREKTDLLAYFNKLKKEVAEIRGKKQDLEFSMLQDSTRQLDVNLEFEPLVKAWSKYSDIKLKEVLYSIDGELREWSIKGQLQEKEYSMHIICKTDDESKRGYVHNFSVECSAQPQLELQAWLNSNPGNIQQILTMLKAHYDMDKERNAGLQACKNEFGSVITVTQNETGETLVELGTEEAYYFQIRWKLLPIPKYFAKLKNHCRIACTEDGDACIKANTDLTTVKKRLSQNPIEVIQLLARSITKGKSASNKKKQPNKSMRK